MRIHAAGVAVALLVAAAAAHAQQKDPVSNAMRRWTRGDERNLIGSAESMPADKYGFKPTAPQMTFGELMAHVADDSNISCGGLAGASAKPPATPKATDGKDQIVAGLKAAFAF